MKARVYVTLKSGVLDPQGRAVETTLGRLGFEEVKDVRIGKYVELSLGEADPAVARARVGAMCEKLLANTVIEDYRIEFDEGGE
jgi:phosphoribosylformylglycinamidine synthase subunit PurS